MSGWKNRGRTHKLTPKSADRRPAPPDVFLIFSLLPVLCPLSAPPTEPIGCRLSLLQLFTRPADIGGGVLQVEN
jgi:hypothetical protein